MPKTRSLEEYTNATAQKLPEGKLYNAKDINNTNLRNLLKGLSQEFVYVNDKLNEILNEYDPRTTTKFIEEWETAIGIPDDCFSVADTLEERRNNILRKIFGDGIFTEQDFIDLAEKFGLTVTIKSGIEEAFFPYTFPKVLYGSATDARFTMIVEISTTEIANTFPYTFPKTFTDSIVTVMQCFFNKLKPANSQIVFRYI